MKICNKCKKEKEVEFFRKNSCSCKDCAAIYDKEYRICNKERIAKRMSNYYSDNKSSLIDKQKKYVANNKEIVSQKKKDYYLSHKKEIIMRQNIQEKKRRKLDPNFKLKKNISSQIRYYLKRNNSSKCGKTSSKYLSYSILELKEYLEKQFEPWMNWSNHGNYSPNSWIDNDSSTWTWQIDHIIPQSSLPYTNMTDDNFKKCWSLENLRPLSSKINWVDGIFRVRHLPKGKCKAVKISGFIGDL